ncbi:MULTISPECIES: GerAB/ArcD/ProY family transporter [Clostridia]|uniref:GerAB/ArcD/ProY family transporter n=1 Tax=Clostridia TaxID=186801 RepID=UPI000E55057B|nr:MULTISPECIES: GerAB/ArcD/ProY family transporter [Clostridia]RHV66160.1 hypothetical protein DXB15_13335 [Roseburia sp. OM02-15]
MRDRIIFSDNQQVSARQISRALFLEMLGLSTLLLPPALARLCGTDGVFAILFGGVLTYLLSVAWNRYDTNVKQNDTSEQYCNTKVLKNTTMVIYIGAFLGIAAYVMYFLSTLIEEQLLGKSYEAAIVLTLTGAAFWGLWKGLESRLRVYEVLFWILILPLGFILLAACSGVCTDYWTPVVDTSWQNFGKGILLCVLIFSLSLLAFCSKSQCSRPEQLLRATRWSLCAVVIWNAIIYLILLGVFQVGLLSHLSYPIIDLMAVVKLPGNFLERQDALMMGIWFFCLFALLNSMLYYASAPLEKLFSEKGRPKATGICCLAMAALAVWLLHSAERAERMFQVCVWFVVPLLLFLPVVQAIVECLKKRIRQK